MEITSSMYCSHRNELTLKDSGTEQPVWKQIEKEAWHQYKLITVVLICSSERFCQQSVWSRTFECLLECLNAWSHTLWNEQWQGFQTLPKSSESEGRKQKWLGPVFSHSFIWCLPKMSVDHKTYLLHGCVGCTADVTGDHHQNARMNACHHRSQVNLEPQLKVYRLKVFKFRSKGCQGQIEDDVSHPWICYDGDVSL